ncbi:SDR family oxidoreductase [Anatilimnocola floriformis]|uniref:SDR family oxidoreductase n=1 Tax=Anatilimnocola floriformis TaxID=2948575 RepID=UPI0020C5967F|nr:SDR family oxidoreductase [Anatilimnocola floriformis]
MDLQLQDHVVLVTGGAKGIGRSIADVLAAEKAIAVIIGRNQADNETAVAEIVTAGGRAHGIATELTDPAACESAVKQAVAKFGRINGVVNNAGVNDNIGLEEGNVDDFIRSLQRNLIHYYEVVRHALPELKKSQGAIVNIGSKVAETGQGHTSAYAAANGGRNALTREWAIELAKYHIRVNAVIVAECWTPLYEKWIQTLGDPAGERRKIEQRIPYERRMTKSEEIANMVVFLLSQRSSHTTGQLIHVDGGYTHLDRAFI